MWGVVDQGLSSLTNFLAALVIVRLVSTSDVGAFAVANALYLFVLAAFRAFAAKPFSIRLTTAAPHAQNRARADLAGLALAVGAVLGVGGAVADLATAGSLGGLLLILGVGAPLLLLQDALRIAVVAEGRARLAVVSDLVWLVVQGVVVVSVFTLGDATVGWLFGAWVIGGSVAGLVLLVVSGTRASAGGPLRFLREHGELGWRLGLEQSFSRAPTSSHCWAWRRCSPWHRWVHFVRPC